MSGFDGVVPGAEATLLRFNDLRERILAVLDRGRQLADVLGPLRSQIIEPFDGARQAIDLSKLNLVVIGAEGHGKSTLINSIMGIDVSPEEEMQPGTVAPIFLEWGPTSIPEFFIDQRDATLRKCKDYAEFQTYVLQKLNANNSKGVRIGVIKLDHPYLRQGLRLVDMPGVEGVSPFVNQIARQFIKEEAHAVIGVVRDRQYAPLLRVLQELGGSKRLSAIVCNKDSYFYRDSSVVNRRIDEQPDILNSYLKDHHEREVTQEQVFVLHLPSVVDIKNQREPRVTHPAQNSQQNKFDTFIWEYIRSNGFPAVLVDGANRALNALAELQSRIAVRRGVIKVLIVGDPGSRDKIKSEYDIAAAKARESWEAIGNGDNLRALAEEHWPPIHKAVTDGRDAVHCKVNAIEREVNETRGQVTKTVADQYQVALQQLMIEQMGLVSEEQRRSLNECAKYFCKHANYIIEEMYRQVPVLAETVESERIQITPERLVNWTLNKMAPGAVEQLLKYGTVGGSALIAAKGIAILAIATLPVLPFLGALVVGGGGMFLYDLIRDGNRAAVLKRARLYEAEIGCPRHK